MEYIQNAEHDDTLIPGVVYNVTCLVVGNVFIPVINHVHSHDMGAYKFTHYHLDDRFVDWDNLQPVIEFEGVKLTLFPEHRPKPMGQLKTIPLKCVRPNLDFVTPTNQIGKIKLKHKCIIAGKCPHTGYILNKVKPINGKIKCPMHSLVFDAKTKKLIKE